VTGEWGSWGGMGLVFCMLMIGLLEYEDVLQRLGICVLGCWSLRDSFEILGCLGF
jgi:hypothetical protein